MLFKEYQAKVGLKVEQQFTPLRSGTYGASRVYTGGRNGIKYVVLHTTGNTASAKNEAANINNNAGIESFHAVADQHGVIETVRFGEVAHHAGDYAENLESLGFELTDDNAAAGYENYIKYVAFVLYDLGITPSQSTVKFHNEIVSTSCGSYLRNKGKTKIIADLNKYIAIAKGGSTTAPKPTAPVKPAQPAKPSVAQLAKQVINGDWGNDPQRSQKLTAAGHNAAAVQAEVNRQLGGGGSAPKPAAPTPIKRGDKVAVTNGVQYNGGRFAVLRSSYDVIEVSGDRVVIGVGNEVTAAVNVANLKRV